MEDTQRRVVYDGQLFRVEHQVVHGRELPYEFVRRVGAVIVLPLVSSSEDLQVLSIHNQRLYYGGSVGLPGGNIDGGFDEPEDPALTAERELREETGFGYLRPEDRNVEVFRLRSISKTVDYPRFIAIMRGVEYLGGEDDNPHEVVTLRPIAVDEYVDGLLALNRNEMYPEVNAAFAKAALELGRQAVLDWLLGNSSGAGGHVPERFTPWLLPVGDT